MDSDAAENCFALKQFPSAINAANTSTMQTRTFNFFIARASRNSVLNTECVLLISNVFPPIPTHPPIATSTPKAASSTLKIAGSPMAPLHAAEHFQLRSGFPRVAWLRPCPDANSLNLHRLHPYIAPKRPAKVSFAKRLWSFFDTFLRRFAKQTEFFFCFCPTALVFSILAPRRLASPCGLKRRGVIPSPLALMRLPIFPLRETNPTAQIYRGSPFPFGRSSRRLPLQICADGVLPSYVRVFAVMCVRMCAFSPHCVRLPVVIASATGARRRFLRHSRAADA